jgi:hypothetical protein
MNTMASHRFQTPTVTSLDIVGEECGPGAMTIHVSAGDIDRIVRALDEASLRFAPAPGGARSATAYRRLAASIRSQAAA